MPDLTGRRIWVMAKGYAAEEGGMQTYAEEVAHAYAAAGADVTVFTQTRKGPRHGKHGPIVLADVGARPKPLLPWRLRTAMRRRMQEAGNPDLVHGTTWRTSLLPMLLNLPYVTTFHGREFMYGGRLRLMLMRRIASRARAVVAVSQFTAGKLRDRLGRGCPDVTVAWNGLSADAPHPAPSTGGEGPLIFSLCRLEPRKNIAACVRALATLRDEGVPFRYVIGGRGPELEAVRALVAELDLGDRVKVTGYLPSEETWRLYAEADIFLHPQVMTDCGKDFEGFGIAIADAMAAGCAVVIGREGGAIELVDEDVTGSAVCGRDQTSLDLAVRRLVTDAGHRKRMGEAAEAHARATFCWHRHVEQIVEAVRLDQAR